MAEKREIQSKTLLEKQLSGDATGEERKGGRGGEK